MQTNVNTTGAGCAQSENTKALCKAYVAAYDSALLAMENLAQLRDLFKVIGSLAKAGDLDSIAIVAADGIYHAEDWFNLHDCEREQLDKLLNAQQAGKEC